MIRTFNRWQHKLFAEYFGLPEGAEPLQNRPLPNHPLPNRPLPAAHANDHEPRVLREWQKSIGNFVERYTAHKEVWEIEKNVFSSYKLLKEKK